MNIAYIALGSNIEPRHKQLTDALKLLNNHEEILVRIKSSIYGTVPVGYTEQADFLNMVIKVETPLSSVKLLKHCQSIERQLGRKREIRFGPRTIDLDILAYNYENRKTEQLSIPHPRMHERAFVLIPLVEIEPNLRIPNFSKSVTELMDDLPSSDKKDVNKWTKKDLVDE